MSFDLVETDYWGRVMFANMECSWKSGRVRWRFQLSIGGRVRWRAFGLGHGNV